MNIALVNELKIVYDAMGIDIWEVLEAARTKPFGCMPFHPGPGLGEHSNWAGARWVNWDKETIRSFDAAIIATHHREVSYQELADWCETIIDTRNAMAGARVKPGAVWKA